MSAPPSPRSIHLSDDENEPERDGDEWEDEYAAETRSGRVAPAPDANERPRMVILCSRAIGKTEATYRYVHLLERLGVAVGEVTGGWGQDFWLFYEDWCTQHNLPRGVGNPVRFHPRRPGPL